jgi:hypothetical protein
MNNSIRLKSGTTSSKIIPLFLSYLICLIITSHSKAQETSTFQADRPGLSTGTFTLQPKTVQLEWGYQNVQSRISALPNAHIYPEIVLRVGIHPKMELNLSWEGWTRLNNDITFTDQPYSSLSAGGKVRIIQEENFNLTSLWQIDLPVLNRYSDNQFLNPSLGVSMDYGLNERVELFGAVQFSTSKSEDTQILDTDLALGSNFSLSDKTGLFIEYVYSRALNVSGESNQPINGGITYLITPKLQFDLYAGLGLNRNTNHFWGTGLAILF